MGKTIQVALFWLAMVLPSPWPAGAQLAITEVMADCSTNFLGNKRPDFWELTNFGPTPISLNGYSFSDEDIDATKWEPFTNLVMRSYESIIICRVDTDLDTRVTTREDFLAWWGVSQLPHDLQVRFWVKNGFDETVGDEVWLRDPANNVVDMVRFGESKRGHSKTYDPVTGVFDVNSEADVHPAFRALAMPTDIASPGVTTGPVIPFIVQGPTNQVIDCCSEVRFSVVAGGLPRSTYQWLSNGVPIPGAIHPTLILPEVNADSQGRFQVRVANGSQPIVSDSAQLIVNTNPLPPFTTVLQDLTMFPGQGCRLAPTVRGYPPVQYQWRSNGVALAGQTNRTLTIESDPFAPYSVATFQLIVTNVLGRAESSCQVNISRRPRLEITEIMAAPTDKTHKPWMELLNSDTNAIDLHGYKLKDGYNPDRATIITNHIVVKPGEAIILVDSMEREAFFDWWGRDRIPCELQVVTWYGWSLASTGEPISLWNPFPAYGGDTVATASYPLNNTGFSLELEGDCFEGQGCTIDPLLTRHSVLGQNGAFSAAHGGDVGSPGITANLKPCIVETTRDVQGVRLRCRVTVGKTYRLVAKSRWSDAWAPVQSLAATQTIVTFLVPVNQVQTATFYRLEEY